MSNPHLVRWIHTSVGKYLKTIASNNSVASLIEGIDQRSKAFMQADDRVEIRVNGPFTTRQSPRQQKAIVFVNVLISSTMGGDKKDAYRLDELLGIFHNAMDGQIPIFKYGTDPVGMEQQIGCLSIKDDKSGSIRVHIFGELAPDVEMRQGVVDAAYTLTLRSF